MEKARQDFPRGAVDKNPSANARDTGSIPIQEDCTCCGATKLVYHNYRARAQEQRSHCNEKPTLHNYREAPAHCDWTKQ